MSFYKTASLKVRIPQEFYEFLRNNYNVIVRRDGTSVVHAEIYIEVDAEGNHQALLPSPYSGTEFLTSYLKDTREPEELGSPNAAAAYYEVTINNRVGKGEYLANQEDPINDIWKNLNTK